MIFGTKKKFALNSKSEKFSLKSNKNFLKIIEKRKQIAQRRAQHIVCHRKLKQKVMDKHELSRLKNVLQRAILLCVFNGRKQNNKIIDKQ